MIETQGIDDILKFFDQYSKKVDIVLDAGLQKGAKKILNTSNALAPRDTGSMITETDVHDAGELRYDVRYNSDYSLYVHEDLEARHPQGQAKFLQEATNQEGRKVISEISKDIGNIRR